MRLCQKPRIHRNYRQCSAANGGHDCACNHSLDRLLKVLFVLPRYNYCTGKVEKERGEAFGGGEGRFVSKLDKCRTKCKRLLASVDEKVFK